MVAAAELGLPIVEKPPATDGPDAPECCIQRTATLDPGPLRKLMQPYYWGGKEWEREYKKQTYVEGSYGNRKNRSTEDLTRGHFRVTRVALVNLATMIAAVSYNRRILRNWHERTGRGHEHESSERITQGTHRRRSR